METAARRDDARAARRGRRCRGDGTLPRLRGGMAEKMPPRERAAAPKSRSEKSRPSPAAAAGATVVPGHPPDLERGDWDIGDIIAELLTRVMDECAKADTARLRVPFAVDQARVALLQMVQWQFLVRDEGDTDPAADGTWREDEEPEPRVGDSWAWGSVPVLRDRPCLCPDEGEVSGKRYGRQDDPAAAEAGAPSAQPLHAGRVTDTDTSTGTGTDVSAPGLSRPELLPDDAAVAPWQGPPLPSRPPLLVPPAPCPCPGPAKSPGQPERGRHLPRWSPRDMEGSSSGGSIHRALPPGAPRGSRETVHLGWIPGSSWAKQEGSGTIPGVPRLHPSQRPERWIRPQVEVLDPGTEDKGLPRPQGAPQGARWCGRGSDLGSSQLPQGLVTTVGARLHLSLPRSPQHPSTLPQQFGSPLDSVQLAPGVTIRRGGSVKHGSCSIPAHGEEEEEKIGEAKQDLRPICPTVPFPVTVARQVTGDG